MKLVPSAGRCQNHIVIETRPALVTEYKPGSPHGRYVRYWLTQVKCADCGKVFKEKKEEINE